MSDLDDEELEATRQLHGVGRDKTADEMLSRLGYMHMGETNENIIWILYGHEYKYEIDFMLKKKEVAYRVIERETDTIVNISGMSMQEIQAINKKVQELRLERINIMEGEIKVGEYIRTKVGNITKVVAIKDTVVWTDDFMDVHCRYNEGMVEKTDIVKHSFNIIDLIEVRRLCKWKKDRCYLRWWI